MFYRVAHHHETGQPYAHPTAISTGCATALVAELLASKHVHITDGQLSPIFNGAEKYPRDALAHTILDTIAGEPQQHPLKMWLRFIGRTATGLVADRLKRTGEATEHTVRSMVIRRATVLRPVDPQPWEGLRGNLYHQLAAERLPSWDRAWLCGILLATGMHHHLLDGAPESAHTYLQWVVSELPPEMRDLINAATAATGEATATRR